jgi:hypothetical protein
VAGAAQDAAEASVRVLNAKARLVELAIEAEAAPGPVERAADAVRAHPWRGVAIALVAGALLGAAPRRSSGVARPLLTPLMGLATDLAVRALGGAPRPDDGTATGQATETPFRNAPSGSEG